MRMLRTLALGMIGFSVYSALRQRSRGERIVNAKPEPLQRWEGEGGNVPAANPALQDTASSGVTRAPRAMADS